MAYNNFVSTEKEIDNICKNKEVNKAAKELLNWFNSEDILAFDDDGSSYKISSVAAARSGKKEKDFVDTFYVGRKGPAGYTKPSGGRYFSGIKRKGTESFLEITDELKEVGVLYFMVKKGYLKLENVRLSSNTNKVFSKIDKIIENQEYLDRDKREWIDSWEGSADGCRNAIKDLANSVVYGHHQSNFYKRFRDLGTKLSGIKDKDKWNPSDLVFTIEENPNLDFNSITDLHNWILDGNLLGISLKKSDKGAVHGAKALKSFLEEEEALLKSINGRSLKLQDTKYRDWDSYEPVFLERVRRVLNGFSNETIVYGKNTDKTPSGILEYIKNNPNLALSFWSSVPPILEALDKMLSSTKSFDYFIEKVAMHCMSRLPLSAPFVKVQGDSHYSTYNFEGRIEVRYLNSFIKMDGSSDCRFNIKIDGKDWNLQLRSKGSLPQFILHSGSYSKLSESLENIRRTKHF